MNHSSSGPRKEVHQVIKLSTSNRRGRATSSQRRTGDGENGDGQVFLWVQTDCGWDIHWRSAFFPSPSRALQRLPELGDTAVRSSAMTTGRVAAQVRRRRLQNIMYDHQSEVPGGRGVPQNETSRSEVRKRMTVVHPEYKRLPKELYRIVVACLSICCVDVILQRPDGKIQLVLRKDEPMRVTSILPGGTSERRRG